MTALSTMLADDVSLHSDGGGERAAAVTAVLGLKPVLRLHKGLEVMFRKYGSHLVRTTTINGLPGFVTREADGELQTTALEIEDDLIVAIYIVRNPTSCGTCTELEERKVFRWARAVVPVPSSCPRVGRSTTFGRFPELDVRSGWRLPGVVTGLAVLLSNSLARADQDQV